MFGICTVSKWGHNVHLILNTHQPSTPYRVAARSGPLITISRDFAQRRAIVSRLLYTIYTDNEIGAYQRVLGFGNVLPMQRA